MSFVNLIKKNFELIISFVAVTMAIAAVIVAFYETSLMREQARLSVKPSVWLETNSQTSNQDDEDGGEFELIINNRGLGPASLEYFSVQRNGDHVLSWQDLLARVPIDSADEKSIRGVSFTAVPQKYVLPNSVALQVFSIRAPSELIRRISATAELFEFTICFCSFYEECWISKGLNTVPQAIPECKIDSSYQFQSRGK